MINILWKRKVWISMNDFKDKIVVVTGGGRGIGAMTARRFVKKGLIALFPAMFCLNVKNVLPN